MFELRCRRGRSERTDVVGLRRRRGRSSDRTLSRTEVLTFVPMGLLLPHIFLEHAGVLPTGGSVGDAGNLPDKLCRTKIEHG